MDSEGCLEKQPKEEKLFQIPVEMRNKRILVVDDNKTNLDILIGYLAAWGFSCDAARDGEMALSMMRALAKVDAPFDLVITDMRMPEMDGAELGRRIKQDPELRETQLIMLTSLDARSEAAMLKGIGFSACLTKPVRRSKLFDSLSAVLGHRKENAPEKRSRLIAPPSAGDIHRKKTRILLAEDNTINRKLALHLLEKLGFQTDAGANGRRCCGRSNRRHTI